MLSSFEVKPPHKIVITGTGRTGTTFLVRLLTALGQPTGYNPQNWHADYFEHCHAGLERKATDSRSPYIVKDPELCVTLGALLDRRAIAVDHAIVPIRDLASATASRIRVGGGQHDIPGGLVGTDTADRQSAVLAERFHTLVHALVTHNVPHTFLEFPRFATDVDYAYEKLNAIFRFDRAMFEKAFRETAEPDLIHTYEGLAGPDERIASAFRNGEHRKKRARRLRKLARWTASGTAVAAVGLALRIAPNLASDAKAAPPATLVVRNARLQSWLLVGSHYRTGKLAYQPFKHVEAPPQPLCLRLPATAQLAVSDVSMNAPLETPQSP